MNPNAGIKPVTLEMDAGGHPFVVQTAVLWDENEVILVDAGLPGQSRLIQETLAKEGFPFDKLTKIIITHQDRDHIGSLHDLAAASGGRIKVLANELTKPILQGEAPNRRGITYPPTPVDMVLRDGDVLPYCGGIRVIFTPGHTPDHMSLYHEPSKTVIAGDALTSQNGKLMPPDPGFTADMDTALKSLSKLQSLNIEAVITYHGGLCTENIPERLAEIAGSRHE
ncbi:MBL fold metallo-hydrolase [Paenibacillus sp. P25]|nr:MBL fold metallo-hydrolase [Paenibacillus sp. P25]